MTREEVAAWLGVDASFKIKPEIVAGMAEVLLPRSDMEHVEAFRVFLACAGQPHKPPTRQRQEETQ